MASLAFASMAERLGGEPGAIAYATLAISAISILAVGLLAHSRDPAEFFLAGRRVTPFPSALGSLAGGLTIPLLCGLSALFFSFGFDGLAFAAGPMAGLMLAGVAITPYLAASKAVTVPDFLGLRYGAPVRILAALVIAALSFIIFCASLAAGADLIARAFVLPIEWAVAGALAAIAICVIPGGINSLTWTGAATAVVILSALILAAIGMSLTAFGTPFPTLAAARALQNMSDLEIGMIEKGLADAAAMKPYAKPFLQIDRANFFGLLFSLMA